MFILLLIGVWIPTCVQGQPALRDSLSQELVNHPQRDSIRANLLHMLAYSQYGLDPAATDSLSREALAIATELDLPEMAARSHYYIGLSFVIRGEFASAETEVMEAIDYHTSVNDSAGLLTSYTLLGGIYLNQGDFQSALEVYLQGLRISEALKDDRNIATFSVNVGLIYYYQEDFEEALHFYQIGYETAKEAGDLSTVATAANNIGAIYLDQGKLEPALTYMLQAEEIKLETDNGFGLSAIVINIGEIYTKKKEFKKANEYLKRGLVLSQSAGDPLSMANAYRFLGRMHTESGTLDSAVYFFQSGLEAIEGMGGLDVKKGLLKELADAYELQGKPGKALAQFRAFSELKDSLYDEEKSLQLAELRTEYETDKHLAEKQQLEEIQALNEDTIHRSDVFSIFLGVGLLVMLIIAGILAWAVIRIKSGSLQLQRKNREVEVSRLKLQAKNEKLAELDREKDHLIGIVAHDLRAPMAKVSGLSELISLSGSLNSEQENLLEMIQKVSEEGNRLIGDLLMVAEAESERASLVREEFEISSLLEEVLGTYQKQADHKQIELNGTCTPGEIQFNSDRTLLSRILENLLSNAIKFSDSGSSVSLTAVSQSAGLRISVIDQGPGISPEDQKRMFRKFERLSAQPTAGESSTGLGLSIIKALTEKLKGTIEVESELGEGTAFHLDFPPAD